MKPSFESRFLTAVVMALLTMGMSSCSGNTQAEQSYLDGMHNPCKHPEMYSNVREGQYSSCGFTWADDDKTQVAEGHEICNIEKTNPPSARYEAPYAYLQTRHPNYSQIQINTQMIAAEHTLC